MGCHVNAVPWLTESISSHKADDQLSCRHHKRYICQTPMPGLLQGRWERSLPLPVR